MFLVPIAVVVFLIWFMIYCVNTYKTTQYDTGHRRFQSRMDYLRENFTNHGLETKLIREHEKQFELNKKIVSEFMGGGKEWEDYTGPYLGEVLAVAVILAQKGLIETSFLSTLNPITNGIKDDEKSVMMNVKFMLALEGELNKHDLGVIAMFQNPLIGPNPDPPEALRNHYFNKRYDNIYPKARFWFQ